MAIDVLEIRYIENGEPHDKEVYNRPTKDLVVEVDRNINNLSQQSTDDAIVYAIALG